MRTRIKNILECLKTSYWFVPGIMLIAAFALAIISLWIDHRYMQEMETGYFLLYDASQDNVREMLSVIATSVITIAGVAFSIIIVSLTLASAQYGPHLLRQYMKSRGVQISLGVFVSTFLYSILILRMMENYNSDFTPMLSGSIAFLKAILCVLVFVYFIHHSANALQVSAVVESIQKDLEASILQLYPSPLEQDAAAGEARVPAIQNERPPQVINAKKAGYVQAVNVEQLVERAAENVLVIHLDRAPGDFVIVNDLLMRIYAEQPLEDKMIDALRAGVIVGRKQTPEQDIEYYLNELVEIAVRALSPGINDYFTAYLCFDWLSASFSKLARRAFPSECHRDADQVVCVVTQVKSFETMLVHTYTHLLEVAGPCAPVRETLKNTLEKLHEHCERQAHKILVRKLISQLNQRGQ